MSSPHYLAMKGKFVIVGKEPDGDSVRFIADSPDLYRHLHRSYRIKPSQDGSVQLRFEGVDAPELHYGTEAQPLGEKARDELLSWMGFANIVYKPHSTMVQSADPAVIQGAILTKAAEANGRPISYVLTGQDADQLTEGTWAEVDATLLQATMNYRLLTSGMAYYTVYTSTPLVHRQLLREAAALARSDKLEVWGADMTGEFVLEDQDSIKAPDGQLILPKLFRRCTDYLKDVEKGFQGNLADWLIWVSQGSRNENDLLVVSETLELHLSDLLEQRNRRIVFKADLLDITFVEK